VENLGKIIHSKCVTWCGTYQLHRVSLNCLLGNFRCLTCFEIMYPKSLQLSSKHKLVTHFSNQRNTLSFVDKTMEGSSSVCSSCSFMKSFSAKTMRTATFAHWNKDWKKKHHLQFFCRLELIHQTFLKLGRQNISHVFRLTKMHSRLFLFIFEWRHIEIFVNRILFENQLVHYESWQVSWMHCVHLIVNCSF